MYDEMQNRIIEATMNLIMQKGYSATTTKDIAKEAGINECTIFRKFNGKKAIVKAALTLPEWNSQLEKEHFSYTGNVEDDLLEFAKTYNEKVTPHMVKVSIGLRSPDLYDFTASEIIKVPDVYKRVLHHYFQEMYAKDKIKDNDFEGMAMQFLSMNFGFVFLKASFEERLSNLSMEDYIKSSVKRFVKSIL